MLTHKLLRRLLPLCLALAMAAAALALCGCAALDEGIEDLAGGDSPYKEYYDKGVEAYNSGDFYAARDYFLTANGYGNSQEFLDAIDEYERIYLDGVAQLEAKDYDAALKSFTAVENFSNAQEYVDHINSLKALYEEGLSLYSEQDFVAAREKFVQSCEYGSAADYIASIDVMEQKYQVAMGLYNEHKYRPAIAAFEAIGANYKDTYDVISAIYGILEHSGVNITTYLSSYKKSFEEAGSPVEFVLTDINETGFMITDSNGLLLIGNTREDGMVTEISFWMEEAVLENMTEDEANAIFAHCIRALDIDMMSYADVCANMGEYTEGKATYGNFSFELDFDDAGYAVLKAKFIGDEE